MIYDLSSLIDEAEIKECGYQIERYKKEIENILPRKSNLTLRKEKKILKKHFYLLFGIEYLKRLADENERRIFFKRVLNFLKENTFYTIPYLEYKHNKLTYNNIENIYKSYENDKKSLSGMSKSKILKKIKKFGINEIFNFLETNKFEIPNLNVDLYTWEPEKVSNEKGFWYLTLHKIFPNFQPLLLEKVKEQIIDLCESAPQSENIFEIIEKLPFYNFFQAHISEFGLKNIEKFFNTNLENINNFFARKYIQSIEEMEPELNIFLIDYIFSNIDLYNVEHNKNEVPTKDPFLIISHDYWCKCEWMGLKNTEIEKNKKLRKTYENFQKSNFLQSKIQTDHSKSNFFEYLTPGICQELTKISFKIETKKGVIEIQDVKLSEYIGLIEKNRRYKNFWEEAGVNWNEEIENN